MAACVDVDRQRSLLRRNRPFAYLWLARSASLLGDRFALLGIPALLLANAHASAGQVGLVYAVEYLPVALLAFPAASWLEGRSTRLLMACCDLVRSCLLGVLVMLALSGRLDSWHVFAVAFVNGSAGALFDVAAQIHIPQIVPEIDLARANGHVAQANSGADIVGPALAGLFISTMGAPVAVLVNSATLVVSFVFLLMSRSRVLGNEPVRAERMNVRGLREGLRFVSSTPYLRLLAYTTGVMNLGGAMIGALWFPYVTQALGMAPEITGSLISVGGVSALIAAMLAPRFLRPDNVTPTLLVTLTAACLVLWLVPLAVLGFIVPALAGYQLIFGAASVTFGITQNTVRQERSPADLQGRTYAFLRVVALGALPLGGVLSGWLASAFGQVAAVTAGATLAATSLLSVGPLARALRSGSAQTGAT